MCTISLFFVLWLEPHKNFLLLLLRELLLLFLFHKHFTHTLAAVRLNKLSNLFSGLLLECFGNTLYYLRCKWGDDFPFNAQVFSCFWRRLETFCCSCLCSLKFSRIFFCCEYINKFPQNTRNSNWGKAWGCEWWVV